jgi:UPF0716 family protein affecting phage T7 exclusion
MFLLETSAMGTVFAVYGAFWLVVIVALYFVVGMFLRKQERHAHKGGHGHGGGH